MTKDLHALTQVSQVQKDRALKAHQRNLADEARLQAELDEIDTLRQAAQADTSKLTERRVLGADTLWQGWLLQRRARVLEQMAMARARQAQSYLRARESFARDAAISDLEQAERRALRARAEAKRADDLQELAMLREFIARD
ncbi:MAG: hypothetical protein QNJ09_18850 [Paracoccaceae bacterium]|nr:hypothetical protein [Paracoccaceae bacterium]